MPRLWLILTRIFTNDAIEFLDDDRVHDYNGQDKTFARDGATGRQSTAHIKGYKESYWYGAYAECA